MDAVAQEEIHWRKKSWYKEAWDVGMDLNEMVARVHLTGYSDIPDTTIANTKISWNDHNVALTTMNAKNGINVYATNQVRGEGVLFNSDAGNISVYGKNGTTIDSKKVEKYIKEVGWDIRLSASALGGLVSLDSARAMQNGDFDSAKDATIQGNRTLHVLDNLKNVDGGLGLLNLANAGFEGLRVMSTAGGIGQGLGVTNGGNGANGLFDVNVRLGTVNNKQAWTESFLSQINAKNGSVMIGSDVDVNLLGGTQINAGKDIILTAGRDLNIAANADSFKQTSKTEGVRVGYNGGWYVGVDASRMRTDGATMTNAGLVAGGNIVTRSGRDTAIQGANLLAGKMLDIDAGRNLWVESVQNSSKSSGWGFDVTVGYGSGSASAYTMSADKNSTDNMTTLVGREGVKINVGGHTHIEGAMIANIDANGVDQGNLVLNTNTLSFADLAENDDYRKVGVSGSYGGGAGQSQPSGGSMFDSTAGMSYDYRDVDAVTKATIGNGTITIRDTANQQQDVAELNRDINNMQETNKIEKTTFEITIPLNVNEQTMAEAKQNIANNMRSIEIAFDKARLATEPRHEIAADITAQMEDQGYIDEASKEKIDAVQKALDEGKIDRNTLAGCGASASLLDWFIAPAYASGCSVRVDGETITLEPREQQIAVSLYDELAKAMVIARPEFATEYEWNTCMNDAGCAQQVQLRSDAVMLLMGGAELAETAVGARILYQLAKTEGVGAAASALGSSLLASLNPKNWWDVTKPTIQFGKVDNQIYHTFRHVEAAGFDKGLVQNAITNDLNSMAQSMPQGIYNGSVVVNGTKFDYNAFKLPNGTVNVGRITIPQ
ncbi:MAG: hypothetical protein K0R63_1332 [Rickettsiales bacterium]|nr:hypothetical protein [Rickettsiales bacterium]